MNIMRAVRAIGQRNKRLEINQQRPLFFLTQWQLLRKALVFSSHQARSSRFCGRLQPELLSQKDTAGYLCHLLKNANLNNQSILFVLASMPSSIFFPVHPDILTGT
jgi:hypothetical protein